MKPRHLSSKPALPSVRRVRVRGHGTGAGQEPGRAQPRARRSPRSDGVATRRQILEAAGRLYAEKGYARTTSKEICAHAGTNMAAVNYHFGSKAGLYEEVLIEAHQQIMSLDRLQAIAGEPADPIAKLRTIVGAIVARGIEPAAPWGVRVVVRELMSPSPHARALVERAIAPKAGIARGLVAAALGLPESHAAVQRCLAFLILPAMALVIVPHALRRTILPAIDADPGAFGEDLARYASAGLRAMQRRYAGRKKGSRKGEVDARLPHPRLHRPG